MERPLYRIGFRAAFVALVAVVGFDIAQILQIIGLLGSPWDGILIYGFSLFIATPFMLALLALHYLTPDGSVTRVPAGSAAYVAPDQVKGYRNSAASTSTLLSFVDPAWTPERTEMLE